MGELRILTEQLTNAKIDMMTLKAMYSNLDHDNDPMGIGATFLRCLERTRQEVERIEAEIEAYEHRL